MAEAAVPAVVVAAEGEQVCDQCDARVQSTDRIYFLKKLWHSGCFRCMVCSELLTVSSCSPYEGQLFCRAHYIEAFNKALSCFAFVDDAEKDTRKRARVAVHSACEPAASRSSQEVEAPGGSPKSSFFSQLVMKELTTQQFEDGGPDGSGGGDGSECGRDGSEYGTVESEYHTIDTYDTIEEEPETGGDRQNQRRRMITKELVDTERSYVTHLAWVVELLVHPLKTAAQSSKPIISHDDVLDIFSNVETLAYCHALLADALEERIAGNEDAPVGDLLLSRTKFLKIYTNYVNNYDNALATLKRVNKLPRFKKFVHKFEEDNKDKFRKLELKSFLIMPIQRVPRYVLLLKSLCKHTDPSHADFNDLEAALASFTDLVEFIDNSKINADNMSKIKSIQNSMTGEYERLSYDLSRKFIREGVLYKLPSRGSGGKRKRQFFLFNDVLIYAAIKANNYEFKGQITLDTAAVKEGPQEDSFLIVNAKATFVILCNDVAEKKAWTTAVEQCIASLRESFLSNTPGLAPETPKSGGPSELRDVRHTVFHIARRDTWNCISDLEKFLSVMLEPLLNAEAKLLATDTDAGSDTKMLNAKEIPFIAPPLMLLIDRFRTIANDLSTPEEDGVDGTANKLRETIERDWLKVYVSYVRRAKVAAVAIRRHSEADRPFRLFTDSAIEKLGQPVSYFITLPFKLLASFVDLCKEVLHHPSTVPADGEAAALRAALKTLTSINDEVGALRREHDRAVRLVEVLRSMTNMPAEDRKCENRSYVREGLLRKLPAKRDGGLKDKVNRGKGALAMRQRQFFCFSDCLIYARVVGSGVFEFRGCIPLKEALIKEARADEAENAFEVHSQDAVHVVVCQRSTERDAWVNDVQHCIDVANGRETTTPLAYDLVREIEEAPPILSDVDRYEIIKQAIDEQRQGIAKLDIIRGQLFQPLRMMKLLDAKDLEFLAQGLDSIIAGFEGIQLIVAEVLSKWDCEAEGGSTCARIALIFESKTPDLIELCNKYFKGVTTRMMLFDTTMRSEPKFLDFLIEVERDYEINVRRLLWDACRGIECYTEMLQNILSVTSCELPEHGMLANTAKEFLLGGRRLGLARLDAEHEFDMVLLQNDIEGFDNLVNGQRWLLREGTLTKFPKKNVDKERRILRGGNKRRHFLLFNDVVVYCAYTKHWDPAMANGGRYTRKLGGSKKPLRGLQYKGRIELTSASVHNMDDTLELRNAFRVEDMNARTAFVILAETPLAKTDWMTDMHEAIGSLQLPGGDVIEARRQSQATKDQRGSLLSVNDRTSPARNGSFSRSRKLSRSFKRG